MKVDLAALARILCESRAHVRCADEKPCAECLADVWAAAGHKQ